MNSGANIKYLGTQGLFITPNDTVETGRENLTELSRQYCVRKDKIKLGHERLIPGFRAERYTNLYLFNPPKVALTETHAFFNCMFYGVLSTKEGGRGSDYESSDTFSESNIGASGFVAVYPGVRYYYTLPFDAPDRSLTRKMLVPSDFTITNETTGVVINVSASQLFWDRVDYVRDNFGKYDRCYEAWKLRLKSNVIVAGP